MAVSGDLTALPSLLRIFARGLYVAGGAVNERIYVHQVSIGDIHAKVPIFDVPFKVHSVYKLRDA